MTNITTTTNTALGTPIATRLNVGNLCQEISMATNLARRTSTFITALITTIAITMPMRPAGGESLTRSFTHIGFEGTVTTAITTITMGIVQEDLIALTGQIDLIDPTAQGWGIVQSVRTAQIWANGPTGLSARTWGSALIARTAPIWVNVRIGPIGRTWVSALVAPTDPQPQAVAAAEVVVAAEAVEVEAEVVVGAADAVAKLN